MEIIKFGAGKDILTWDPIGRQLDWKGFCFPQEGLLPTPHTMHQGLLSSGTVRTFARVSDASSLASVSSKGTEDEMLGRVRDPD